MKFILGSIILLFILSSCSNKVTLPGDYQIQILPEKSTEKEITNLRITYIIPKNTLDSEGIGGIIFSNRQWGRETKQEKISFNFNNNILQIERRTDNGLVGSGCIYNIKVTQTNELNNRLIVLQAESMNTYQDGVILPFPLPEFDLESYLISAKVKYNFELNSEFPAESIRANFDRMLEKSENNYYMFSLNEASILMNVKVYPYRNGSRIFIEAELSNMRAINNIINVTKNILALEKYIKNIVNS